MRLRMELFVDDLDVTVAFYSELLGFRVDRRTDGYASLSRGDVVLGFGPAAKLSDQDRNGPGRGTGVEIVLELDDLDDVTALYEHCRSRVAGIEPLRPQPWGLHDFRLFDPDGYYVRVTHPAGARGRKRSAARTPEDTVRAVAAGVCRLVRGGLTAAEEAAQIDELAACYAEQTDVRHPLHPLGDTPLLSRAAVREHFAAGGPPVGVERYDVIDDHVFVTPDPEVVIFEFRYAGVVGGRAFTLPCVFVVRVRDGEIVESRDYADHVGGARAFGRLRALAAALTAADDET
jgi:ketosteroid isomerase-like protein/uncharacterized glyoxalase superfamily protein PhnB